MTDTNLEEKERQQFEAWCAKELELPDGYELNFGNDTVRLLSRGWFARAALAPAATSYQFDGQVVRTKDGQYVCEVVAFTPELMDALLAPAAACVMPEPKKYTWDEIVGLVSEVLGCQYQKDPDFFIGHQMPGINFNSLSRIIDRVQHREAARLNRNPIPVELLERIAAHLEWDGSPPMKTIDFAYECDSLAAELRALLGKDDE